MQKGTSMTDNNEARQRAAVLAKPFVPFDTSKLDQNTPRSDLALLRLAHAAEYIAGQSYVIRDLLEESDLADDLEDITKAIHNVASEVRAIE